MYRVAYLHGHRYPLCCLGSMPQDEHYTQAKFQKNFSF